MKGRVAEEKNGNAAQGLTCNLAKAECDEKQQRQLKKEPDSLGR